MDRLGLNWLQDFAYKTTLSFWVYALSGIGVLGLAVLTISYKALYSAKINPVGAIRVE